FGSKVSGKNKVVNLKIGVFFFDDQYRGFGGANHLFGIGTYKEFFKTVGALGAHNNEIAVAIPAGFHDAVKSSVEKHLFMNGDSFQIWAGPDFSKPFMSESHEKQGFGK